MTYNELQRVGNILFVLSYYHSHSEMVLYYFILESGLFMSFSSY